MSDTVKAWIEERRAIHREATEDTARVLWEHDDPEGESPNENFDSEPKWEQERLKRAAQAILESSDAHNMFPRALNALQAVLKVHSPGEVFTWAEDCADPENHHLVTDVRSGDMLCEDEPLGRFCNGCVPENDTMIDMDEYPWPCPTVQTIEGAINE